MNNTNTLPPKAIISAILCNVIFGTAFPMIKIGYELFKVTDDIFMKMLFAGIRFTIAGLLLLLFGAVKNKKIPKFSAKKLPLVIVVSLVYISLQYVFFYVGLSNTSGASGSVISSSSVFMAVILAHFIYKDDKLTILKFIGAIVGFGGVLFAVLSNESFENKVSFMGEGLMAIAALSSVIGSVLSKYTSKTIEPSTLAAYNLFFGGIMLTIPGIIFTKDALVVAPLGILTLLYLCFVSAFGYTVQSKLFKEYSISKVSVYSFVTPVSGAFFSGIFLGENILRWEYLLALALVSVGIIAVNYRKADKT